eukprot:1568866-Rhodomonas_salina.2
MGSSSFPPPFLPASPPPSSLQPRLSVARPHTAVSVCAPRPSLSPYQTHAPLPRSPRASKRNATGQTTNFALAKSNANNHIRSRNQTQQQPFLAKSNQTHVTSIVCPPKTCSAARSIIG